MSDVVQRGEAAGLSSCRVQHEQDAALQQILDLDEEILLGPVSVQASFGEDTAIVPGSVVITSGQLLFWQEAASDHDLRADAVSIDLHAMTSTDDDDSPAVYIHLLHHILDNPEDG